MERETDASHHRLNPPSTLTIPLLRDRRPKSGPESEIDTETKCEDSAAAEGGTDPGDNEAKRRSLQKIRYDATPALRQQATPEPIHEAHADVSAPDAERGQSRVGPRWLIKPNPTRPATRCAPRWLSLKASTAFQSSTR